ncbi:MAG: DNA mismatch endonuclease Vsr [Syntrophaceae bacterium]|nr:DNA mismatch endonuclease Vsr [Syntrophaceae bacterium]
MAAIRNKDTKPELIVRRMVHGLGYRYRLHGSGLPGKPDLIFASRRKVIFVHGCFWHRHSCSKGRSMPATRTEFWMKKLENNKCRDENIYRKLSQLGWSYLVIWECEMKPSKINYLARRVIKFMES